MGQIVFLPSALVCVVGVVRVYVTEALAPSLVSGISLALTLLSGGLITFILWFFGITEEKMKRLQPTQTAWVVTGCTFLVIGLGGLYISAGREKALLTCRHPTEQTVLIDDRLAECGRAVWLRPNVDRWRSYADESFDPGAGLARLDDGVLSLTLNRKPEWRCQIKSAVEVEAGTIESWCPEGTRKWVAELTLTADEATTRTKASFTAKPMVKGWTSFETPNRCYPANPMCLGCAANKREGEQATLDLDDACLDGEYALDIAVVVCRLDTGPWPSSPFELRVSPKPDAEPQKVKCEPP